MDANAILPKRTVLLLALDIEQKSTACLHDRFNPVGGYLVAPGIREE